MSHQDQFAYILKNGLAKPNRFLVEIPIPNQLQQLTANVLQEATSSFISENIIKLASSFVGAGASEITRGFSFMTEQTEMPGKNLTTTDVRYNGDFYKLPYGVTYGAHPITFRVSRDMYEKNIIDDWMNRIYNPNTHEVGYMDDYAVDIRISQLDDQDNIVYTAILKDAFPTTCNPLTLSNEEFNQWHRLAVTFMYRRWHREGELDINPNGVVDSFSKTPLGPLVTPILSDPRVQRVLDVLEDNLGIDLEGEALNVYNQVDQIARATTGTSINKSISLIEGIKAATESNNKITGVQETELLEIIDNILFGLRS